MAGGVGGSSAEGGYNGSNGGGGRRGIRVGGFPTDDVRGFPNIGGFATILADTGGVGSNASRSVWMSSAAGVREPGIRHVTSSNWKKPSSLEASSWK